MASQNFKLSLNGKLIHNQKFKEEKINEYFRIDESYSLNADRSDSLKYDLELSDDKIVQLETSEGIEWICYADDIPEIYGRESEVKRSEDGESFQMIPEISQRGGTDRSGKDAVKNILLNVIVSGGAKITAQKLAKTVDDKKCTNPGLFKIDRNRKTIPKGTIPSDKACLLLIHGTISSYEGGFDGIKLELWEKLWKRYDGNIYAFNHRTLTKSPIENVRDLIEELPSKVMFDIISHSRGGLVADTLARCDYRNKIKGFEDEDINLIKNEFELDRSGAAKDSSRIIVDAMHEINKVVRFKKEIAVNKVIRVACPAAGTTLLSKRLDHFLNAILSLIGLAVGSKLNPFYQYVKLFLLKVVEEKSNPESFPGLWSMVPDSAFQIINNKNVKLSSHLVSIAGDSKIGNGFLHSLKVILTNLYYWRENDFVVNTASMTKGLSNRQSNSYYKIQNKHIDHFTYFKVERHMEIVLSALTNKSIKGVDFINIAKSYSNRGILLKLAEMGELRPKLESGTKPIVVLVPGIMGSNIYFEKDRKWLDFVELNKGALGSELDVENYGKTSSDSIIEKFYKAFHDFLIREGHDVIVHPFDWRKSLSDCVDEFDAVMKRATEHKKAVRIVAHSMGGLLVRQWKIKKDDSWLTFRNSQGSKFIMLGTPWKGSHLITEVLTGHSKRVKQLHLLDFKHNKRELLESLVNHKGLFDLLPLSDKRMTQFQTWNQLKNAAGKRNMAPIPRESFDHFVKYQKEMIDHFKLSEDDQEIIYYVAGNNKKTLNDFEIKKSFFRGKYIDYKYTSEGDGSVTWASGIPEGLLSDHLYYVDVDHGNLANEEDIFDGLLDLIVKGKTSQNSFFKNKFRSSSSRGGESYKEDQESFVTMREVPLLDADPMDNIFGIDHYEDHSDGDRVTIDVEVFNGDLKWSKHPIMVGHFKHDGIVSAESAIDRYLDNKLSERHLMGFYPGDIGDQEIIYDPQNNPIGAVIIGLGDKDDLTGYNLAKSVEKAMLKYAVFFRDNKMDMNKYEEVSTSISTLLVGSNYGKLLMKESIRSILLGIQDANKIIGQFDSLKKITKVEFVDYYEDNAYECYKILQDLKEEKNAVEISLKNDITVGYRNKKRLLRDESRSWWQSFSTELKEEKDCDNRVVEYLDFGAYNRQASSSKEQNYVNLDLARYMASELSTKQEWNKEDSKVIFEMLLPNRYKDFIRNHRNIEWKLNEAAAAFPWEMFHDFTFGDKPTFTESGLIRQLYSSESNIRPALVRQKTALVIANPLFKEDGGLAPLPGAKMEGESVVKLLEESEFDVIDEIEKGPLDIIKSLFSKSYKVLHIASHGLYDFKNGKVGIAIGDGQLLTPGTLNQLSAIPEFVFVNCCFSGKTKAKDEAYSRERNSLAANIGTQLIKMGVKAVVVAGWAVNDDAAKLFAETLYGELLDGVYFGDAVKKARFDCYNQYSKYNTWGAYQCYGDQFYRLNLDGKSNGDDESLILENEIVMELDNVLSRAKSLEISKEDHSSIDKISKDMQTLVERAEFLGKYSSEVIEREALILTFLGKYKQAVLKYKELFNQDEGGFNVKSLDMYCNIRAKNLVLCEGKECEVTGDNIDLVLRDMKNIKLIGEGPERLSTIGSTYKRAALMVDTKEEIREYLKESAEHYYKAAKIRGFDSRYSIYQLTSFITISSFYNASSEKEDHLINIKKDLGRDIEEYIKNWVDIVDRDTNDRTNIYDQLAKIQLRMASIIGTKKDLKVKTDKIIDLYEIQISRCINLKDLIGEVEWIEFQIIMCNKYKSNFGVCVSYLEQIRDNLISYYNVSGHIDN